MRKHQRPTIFDLERITGYSIGTISRAFNPGTEISAATREVILQKAREIGYAPHSGARALIHGRAGRLGLLLPDLFNPRYAEIMDHLDREARKQSTLLLLGLSRNDPKIEAELVLHWASGEVDGIVADASVDPALFEQPRLRKFPLVFLFSRPSDQYNEVSINFVPPYTELVERCFALGHKRVAYVSPDFSEARKVTTYTGYLRALEKRGLPPDESLMFFGSHDYTAGFEAWQHWRHRPDRPTAFCCFNDIVACTLMQSALDDGMRIPQDLSVVGADDILAASFHRLTTIRTDPAEIAAKAIQLLNRPPSRKGAVETVPATIVERGSIGPPPLGL